VRDVALLGADPIEWVVDGGRLRVQLPDRLPVTPAHVLRISPAGSLRARAR
jgi:hypothetical protein